MLTFEEWITRHTPVNRAYNREDMREGWDGAMRELMVRDWEFRVIVPTGTVAGFNTAERSAWHVIPFICIKPMLDLFAAEIELRPVYVNRGRAEKGVDVLARLNRDDPIPF